MMIRIASLIFLTFISTVKAAEQPDASFLQKAIGVLQTQRNEAMDKATLAETKLSLAIDDIAKDKAEIKRLKDKYEPEKKD